MLKENLVLDEQGNIVGTFTETQNIKAENQQRVESIVSMKPPSFRDYEKECALGRELCSAINPQEGPIERVDFFFEKTLPEYIEFLLKNGDVVGADAVMNDIGFCLSLISKSGGTVQH